MLTRLMLVVLNMALISCTFFNCVQKSGDDQSREFLLGQVGKTAIVRLYADGFEKLSLNDKILAYFLYKAAIAGRDIYYDQNNKYALEVRKLFEEIVTHSDGIDENLKDKILNYTKLFWINNGNYHERTKKKFVPEFTFEEFEAAVEIAQENGAEFSLMEGESLSNKLNRLHPIIFDPNYRPLITNKNPGQGYDHITGSAVNYYEGVTLADVEKLKERNSLNAKVVKENGKVVEKVYRIGTDAIKPGLYAEELAEIVKYFEKAIPYAGEQQQKTLRHLIDYYKTGDLNYFRDANISWVHDDPMVDTINGFIESYKDPRSLKGSWEGIVSFVDTKTTQLMKDLASEAQYFEDNMPWLDKYKKQGVESPVANSINVLVAVGEGGPMSPIGINLPNEQEIRETEGSKSVLLTNVIKSYNEAVAGKFAQEFAFDEREIELSAKYGGVTDDAETAMHEVIGHGSGKVSERLEDKDPAEFLREYESTLEEARAELVALWHVWDDKTIEIGLIPNKEAAEQSYRGYARADLIQLRRIREGDVIEDDHMRAIHLIVSYLREQTKVIDAVTKDGKIYFHVNDLEKMRKGVGELLAELMRIKAEGDYGAIKKLVDTYGIKINTEWRDQVVDRCNAIGIPNFYALVFPKLIPAMDDDANITDVAISYEQGLVEQMLEYSGYSEEEIAAEPVAAASGY